LAQLNCRSIGFIRIQHKFNQLGCPTKTDWQHAGCHGIQGTSMPRFFSAKSPLHFLQSLVGTHTCRFVEQDKIIQEMFEQKVSYNYETQGHEVNV